MPKNYITIYIRQVHNIATRDIEDTFLFNFQTNSKLLSSSRNNKECRSVNEVDKTPAEVSATLHMCKLVDISDGFGIQIDSYFHFACS